MSTLESQLKEPPLLKEDVTTKFLITLEVEAEKLFEMKYPPTKKVIYDHCFLSDSTTENYFTGTDIEKFESRVKRDQLIEWVGVNREEPKDAYKVTIESIVYGFYKENSLDNAWKENFFDKMVLCSKGEELISRKVKMDFETIPAVYIYNINFNITKGEETKMYSLDPRLKVDE